MNNSSPPPENDAALGDVPARVEIYSWLSCGYCVRAKRLLRDKGIKYVEHRIDGDEEARRRMIERTGGRRSLPQIFIDGQAIGGFLELYQLEKTGRLDDILNGGAGVLVDGKG